MAMIDHCDSIVGARLRFGDSFDVFSGDRDYFNSVCVSDIKKRQPPRPMGNSIPV